MKSHEFLNEAEVSPYQFDELSLQEAVDVFKEYCSMSVPLLSRPIYRGMRHDESALTIYPFTGVRKSQNTSNHFTSLVDNSPYFEGWPKRSKSVVCSTSHDYAGGFGSELYTIFPFNRTNIAVCPASDLWDNNIHISMLDFDGSVDDLNRVFKNKLALPSEFTKMQKYVTTPKFKERLHYYCNLNDIAQINPNEFLPRLQKELSPKKLGFTLMSIPEFINKNFDNREIWIGGPVLAIRQEDLKEFVKLVKGKVIKEDITLLYESIDSELHSLVKQHVSEPLNNLSSTVATKLKNWAIETLHAIKKNVNTTQIGLSTLRSIINDPNRFAQQLITHEIQKRKVVTEGGWANPVTQDTHITPTLVNTLIPVLHKFVDDFNLYLKHKDVPPVELGNPCGSTTYFKRDMMNNPDKEYGDIDINFHIPKLPDMTNNANANFYKTHLKEFCDSTTDFQTENGTNIIVQLGNNFVQVDFVTSYIDNKAWTTALAPEYNVKGVLCNSIYSSLGEALQLSIGGSHGVQAKFQDQKIVPFRTVKNVELKTITTNPTSWGLDIVKFFGCDAPSKTLRRYPGKLDEVRVSDMIQTIRGIAETLEQCGKLPTEYATAADLLNKISAIYSDKISKAIASSKFDKATTPAAIEKAEKTKQLLADKGTEFATALSGK